MLIMARVAMTVLCSRTRQLFGLLVVALIQVANGPDVTGTDVLIKDWEARIDGRGKAHRQVHGRIVHHRACHSVRLYPLCIRQFVNRSGQARSKVVRQPKRMTDLVHRGLFDHLSHKLKRQRLTGAELALQHEHQA